MGDGMFLAIFGTRFWGTGLFRQVLMIHKKMQRVHTFMPRQVRMEFTKICNLKCVGCRRAWEDDISAVSGDKNLTLDGVKSIVEQVPALELFGFSGDAETTANPHLWDVLRYLKSKKVRSTFTTNNTLLNEERIGICEDCGVIRISVSQAGAKRETFEKIRIGAKFDKVMENNYLIGYSSIPLFLNFPMLTREMMNEIPEFFRIARNVRATGVQFLKLMIEDADHLKPLDFFELKAITDDIKRRAKEGGFHLEGCLAPTPVFRECYEPVVAPLITLNGDVYPCAYAAKQTPKEWYGGETVKSPVENFVLGNTNKQGIKEIWYGVPYKALRKYLKETSQPIGRAISQSKLQEIRTHPDDNRFAYCKGCLVRWQEAGS